MSDVIREKRREARTFLAIFITAVIITTAFGVVVVVAHSHRAEMLSEVPLQWQRFVNAAIERGDIRDGASIREVRNWLEGQMPYLSEKVKNSWVNPFAAKKVAKAEAAGGGSTPQEPVAVTGVGKILVILVEFAGSDTYHGVTYVGPLHNQIPPPSPDNNVDYWQEDFSREHYMNLLFGTKGGTLANYLLEQSCGRYTVDGFVTDWVQITDHSEWWYGADSKTGGVGSDDLNGPVWRIAIDAAKAAYDKYGMAIPWYDFDTDGDGWIDSLMVIRAGQEQEPGPSWMIWGHSWFVNWPEGYEIVPGLKIGPYTCEAEDGTLGLFAHEYAHQLGLPDEYDTTYLGESPTGFLTLMSSGMWLPGPTPDGRTALGVSPAHMDVWDKYVLGWLNGATAYITYDGKGAVNSVVSISQVEGSKGIRAIKVELPAQAASLPLPTPRSGGYQWYSGYKPDITDVLTGAETSSYILTTKNPIHIPAAGAKLTFYEWYDIEEYYDFGFVEVSSDNGMSWSALPGRYTTNENPFGGNTGNGITGASKRYILETMDLTAYAGKDVLIRFRLTQDGAVYGLGWTLDDITVTSATGTILFQDLVDSSSEAKWVKSASDELGPGWSLATGNAGGSFRHYYIMEWRNFVGFDAALKTAYQFIATSTVQFWSHTPGLMIWYRNFAMGDNDVGLHPGRVAIGLVDAHPDALLTMDGHFVRQRIQLMDAAFGLRPTVANTIILGGVPTKFPSLPAAMTFDDSNAYFDYQFYKGTYEYCGLKIPTYGLKVTVLSEKRGLTGASIWLHSS